MKSSINPSYAPVPSVSNSRSSFNRSNNRRTTLNSDTLNPVYIDEVLPGDSVNIKMTTFSRLNPTIAPIMDNVHMQTEFFFVPCRLVDDNWQKLMGEQINPGDSTDYLVPQVIAPAVTGWQIGSLADRFGLPTGVPLLASNALPFRAYNLIYNQWYRDENLQNSLTVNTDDGPDPATDYQLQKRNKFHDYFTSMLPWPQKGPSVPIPSSASVPVLGIGTQPTGTFTAGSLTVRESDGTTSNYSNYLATPANFPDNIVVEGKSSPANYPNVRADLTANTEATINALRQAIALQSFYERDARGGTRYTEIIRSHFGVISPDARLQRAEYLGGTHDNIHVAPVVQTSETNESAQGNLAGMGTCTTRLSINKSFTEHGYIIGLTSYRGDITYQQGQDALWNRRTRNDFYWPDFANLGEEAVLNKEIFVTGTSLDEEVLGYNPRYESYRTKISPVTGVFKSEDPQSLDYWTLTQDFPATPGLNSTFVTSSTPMLRVMAVPTQPEVLHDIYFQETWARPIPAQAIPGKLTRL